MKSIESTEITLAGSPASRTTLGVAILAIGGLVAGGLTGCATTATPSPQLEKARSEVQAASQDPDAARAGGVRLATAQEALEKAEAAFDKGNQTAEDNYAYSATRNAQIAREQAAASRARKAVEAGEAERNRVVIESRSREAAKAQSEAARLKAELAELKAKQTDRGMVLTLGDVLFDTNKATVRAGAISNLQRLASVMQEQSGLNVIVEGHTDSTGAAEYNRELSMRRASAVANVLMQAGVTADRVRPIGLGEDFPVASNDTATGRQQNRRVEVVFSDETGKFVPGAERRNF